MKRKLTVILGVNIYSHISNLFESDDASRLIVYPELNHNSINRYPEHVKKYIPVLVEKIKFISENLKQNCMIVTQSAPVLNKIGEMIEHKQLENFDVEVHLYNDNNSSYTIHKFDQFGALDNSWPFGWFEFS
jgi:hypothetical protein